MTNSSDPENSDYPAILACGIVLTGLLLFGTIVASLYTNNQNQSKVQSTSSVRAQQMKPNRTFALDSEIVVTVGYDTGAHPVTVHVKPALAFNQENKFVKVELRERQSQIKNVILETLTKQPVDVYHKQKLQLLRDKLTNEINKILTRGGRIQTVYFQTFYMS